MAIVQCSQLFPKGYVISRCRAFDGPLYQAPIVITAPYKLQVIFLPTYIELTHSPPPSSV